MEIDKFADTVEKRIHNAVLTGKGSFFVPTIDLAAKVKNASSEKGIASVAGKLEPEE